MQKWEYKFFIHHGAGTFEVSNKEYGGLNLRQYVEKLGLEGWELVSITFEILNLPTSYPSGIIFSFKRPIG